MLLSQVQCFTAWGAWMTLWNSCVAGSGFVFLTHSVRVVVSATGCGPSQLCWLRSCATLIRLLAWYPGPTRRNSGFGGVIQHKYCPHVFRSWKFSCVANIVHFINELCAASAFSQADLCEKTAIERLPYRWPVLPCSLIKRGGTHRHVFAVVCFQTSLGYRHTSYLWSFTLAWCRARYAAFISARESSE